MGKTLPGLQFDDAADETRSKRQELHFAFLFIEDLKVRREPVDAADTLPVTAGQAQGAMVDQVAQFGDDVLTNALQQHDVYRVGKITEHDDRHGQSH